MITPCASDVRFNFRVNMRDAISNLVHNDHDVVQSELHAILAHRIYTTALVESGFDERIVKNQESYSVFESLECAGTFDVQCRIPCKCFT